MGLLDPPADRAVRKVAVLGKAGCGKSSLVAVLGRKPAKEKHTETMGIHVTSVQGPPLYDASGNDLGPMEFRFWEVGAGYGAKYPYTVPDALKDCDAVLVVFSFGDKESFRQVPSLLSRANGTACLVVGTKADDPTAWAVTALDVNEMCGERNVPVMMVDCLPGAIPAAAGITSTTPRIKSTLSSGSRGNAGQQPGGLAFVETLLKKLAGLTDTVSDAA